MPREGEADIRRQFEAPPPPTIIVRAGERHIAAKLGIEAMQAAGVPFYQRDRWLVRICDIKARATTGEIILVPGIAKVTPAILDRALGQAANWQRVDANKKKSYRIDPPASVVTQILDMAGDWPFPPLSGVIGCPTLRPDGTILAREGYDEATGLVLRSAVKMPALPPNPTREDADAAVVRLNELLAEFPFADEPSRSVALSMLMTPVLRGAMPVAPMHFTTAAQSGSGKSYLGDCASMIATGERIAVVAVAPTIEETEKRLIAAALTGCPVIGVDNCSDTLAGDLLCQVTERPLLSLRPLGSSDQHRIANTFTVFGNGNNIAVADDLVRRTIRCTLDPNVENPELRSFEHNPIASVVSDRGSYVAAILTIARAYVAAGKPGRLAPLASFEAWSDLVRSPLVWLGLDDPVETMAVARDADPVRQDRERVFDAWRSELGLGPDRSFTVPEVIDLAGARFSADGSFQRPALHAILVEIAHGRAAAGGAIEPRRLGRWLTRNENTIAAGLKLACNRSDKQRPRYSLRGV